MTVVVVDLTVVVVVALLQGIAVVVVVVVVSVVVPPLSFWMMVDRDGLPSIAAEEVSFVLFCRISPMLKTLHGLIVPAPPLSFRHFAFAFFSYVSSKIDFMTASKCSVCTVLVLYLVRYNSNATR